MLPCAAAAIFSLLALILYARLRVHRLLLAKVLDALDVPAPPEIDVRPIADAIELLALWEINDELYGSGALPFEAFLAWWRTYPGAVFALRHRGEIAGGITIWPLRGGPFRRLLRGKWALAPSDFYPAGRAENCRHWYVSGIVIRPAFRSPRALRYLMSRAMRASILTCSTQFTVHGCAIAYSSAGARLLERCGFTRKTANTAEGYAVFCLSAIGPRLLLTTAIKVAGEHVQRRWRTRYAT